MDDIRKHKLKSLRSELAQYSKSSSIASSFLVLLYIYALNSIESHIGFSYYFTAIILIGQFWRYTESLKKNVDDSLWLKSLQLLCLCCLRHGFLITGNLILNIHNSEVIVLCYSLVAGLIASGAYSISISKRDF